MHDIGKTFVSVVLQCNNFEVIDLGVMVPADKIIQTAIDEKARYYWLEWFDYTVFGRNGVFFRRMNRLNLNIPVLIGVV